MLFEHHFIDAYLHLHGRPCPSVRPSVGRLVTFLSKLMKNGLLPILNDLDSAGQGSNRDMEDGGTRRKEGRGKKRDEEEGGTRMKERRGRVFPL